MTNHYQLIHFPVSSAANILRNEAVRFPKKQDLLRAFANHVDAVVDALQVADSLFSGERTDAFDRLVLRVVDKHDVLDQTISRAEAMIEELQENIQEARKA